LKNQRYLYFAVAVILIYACFAEPARGASSPKGTSSPSGRSYDVVVAGGGIGGIAAAIQAARMGASVLVVEPSGWIGGQATAAGVSTMDDLSRQRSGIYLEFISRLRAYYDAQGKSMGTCYWDSRSTAFEPSVGQRVLYDMLPSNLDLALHTSVTGVTRDGKSVTGLTLSTGQNVKCKVLIDATEYGDVLPLAGAEYRAGNSVTPFINPDAMIQDITWVAIIRSYPGGVPSHLRPLHPLPGYEEARRNYESYVTRNGFDFKGVYPVRLPVNFVSHNAYRGLPDSSSPWTYDASPDNWKFISKTAVNWGNDYPGKEAWNGRMGLPVDYLENRALRAEVERAAFIKTLHFIYYVQNELGQNWSVTEDEYVDTVPPGLSTPLGLANPLPDEWRAVASRMPPIPYVRESRRIVGDYTLTSEEMLRNSLSYRNGQTSHEFPDAVAIGGYILDLHGANTDADAEWQLAEKASSAMHNRPRGPFQVPMRVMIPKDVDGLLAAEKNISVSRFAAGALRLQPICMMVGQAAGALAAVSAQDGTKLRDVPAVRVQSALLDGNVALSLCRYSDVPPEHPFYKAVQMSNLHSLIDPLSPPHAPAYDISDLDAPELAMAIINGADKGVFGVDELLTRSEMTAMLARARAASQVRRGAAPANDKAKGKKAFAFVSRWDFTAALASAFGIPYGEQAPHASYFSLPDGHRARELVDAMTAAGVLDVFRADRVFHPAKPITRGEAIEMTYRAMTAANRP
jgi:hypothetical protein